MRHRGGFKFLTCFLPGLSIVHRMHVVSPAPGSSLKRFPGGGGATRVHFGRDV